MRMSSGGFRSEPLPHVAQQSRRDKLRVQPIAADNLLQARDVYDSAMFPSATMLDFSAAHGHGFGNPSSSTPADGGCDWSTVGPIHGSLLPSHVYATRPCFPGYQDVPQHGEIPTQDAHSYHFSATPYCQNPLPDVVASSSTHQGLEMATGPLNQPWGQGGNELLLLQGGNPRIDNPSVWMNRQPQQWNGEGGEFSAAQGLSLSLASNPPREFHASQFEERYGAHEGFATERTAMAPGLQSSEMRNEAVALESPYAKLAAGNRGCGIAIQSTVSTCADVRRAVGPLGPFTGYATILKSSKFLKPAQQLLVEFCSVVTGSNLGTHCDTGVRSSGTPTSAAATDNNVSSRAVHSGASSSSFNCSTESGGGSGSSNRAYHQVHRPEFQQKKAKLLFMQEEVCRRYKQYHQQMQMVVSAFESVAGLSAATPYTSLALKSVSKHFRCIKNAISDQIRHISKVLGEEFVSSPSSSKSDMLATPRLKLIDQSLRKSGDNNSGFVDHNPPVWRPQRGLPERSVAVLRAWLFEHFLHPYPTDTDKHMLATQTGLTRNQVSNWFINARVRLWKPMVEEIHMLETKGMAEMNLNSADKSDGKMVCKDDQRSEAQSSKPPSDCSSIVYAPNDANYQNLEQWHREKRSRMEDCIVPGNMDGGLMSLYHGGMDMGGLGAVSLTLGLRHNEGGASGAHQQQPQQITRHFGSQMVHDFVG